MATNTASSHHNDLFFFSLISDIKSYSGRDPLLPWLRGIKKMKEDLPPNFLKEKLPRFLQKCAQTFESDRRYKNDLRYLRVWLQLMDYVDEPKVLLRAMESNCIGTQRSLFYQAYALYYEKMKKFEEAEKLYHLGVKNLAEPVEELQKSYEQFLQRMERHKNKKMQRQEGRTGKRPLSARKVEGNNESMNGIGDRPQKVLNESSQNFKSLMERNHKISANSYKIDTSTNTPVTKEQLEKIEHRDSSRQLVNTGRESKERRTFCGEDTVVVKFVDTAIVGKSEAEDACHHGLVDPTINLKEAMNAINNMFKEPMENAPIRRSQKNRTKEHGLNSGFEVYIDDNLDNGAEPSNHDKAGNISMMQHNRSQMCQPQQEAFQIFVEEEEGDENNNLALSESQNQEQGSSSSASQLNTFVFLCPKDLPSENSNDIDAEGSPRVKLREDTVVHRFVGSTISDEPAVENFLHHGLVDPTINLKEAMDDINNMFGKPIEFARRKRPKSQANKPLHGKQDGGSFSILPDNDFEHQKSQANKSLHGKQDGSSFSILPDDDFEHQKNQAPSKSARPRDADLFEKTVFTKEAMDDINKMFAMPLDF